MSISAVAMIKFFGIFSLMVFLASAVIHIATFIPAIRISMQQVWPLLLGAMIAFGIMVFSLTALQRRARRNKRQSSTMFGRWHEANKELKEFNSNVLALTPRYLRILTGIFAMYVVVNFMTLFHSMQDGRPVAEQGKFFLQKHRDQVNIREISEAEYQRRLAYSVRGVSGHCMIFSLLPAIFFLTVHEKLTQQVESSSPG
jgi:hypothetical protein